MNCAFVQGLLTKTWARGSIGHIIFPRNRRYLCLIRDRVMNTLKKNNFFFKPFFLTLKSYPFSSFPFPPFVGRGGSFTKCVFMPIDKCNEVWVSTLKCSVPSALCNCSEIRKWRRKNSSGFSLAVSPARVLWGMLINTGKGWEVAEAGEEPVASEGPQKAAGASLLASECQKLLVRGSLYNSSGFTFPG